MMVNDSLSMTKTAPAAPRIAETAVIDPEAYVHETAWVDADVRLEQGVRVWHFCHLQRGCHVGANSSLGQNVYVGAGVEIGRNVRIQNNVSVYQGVRLEDGVFCGPSCVFTNDLTPRAEFPKGPAAYRPTWVGRGATIGANATVVCGHTIGAYAMIAAGAVVTADVPPHALMAGVPARQIGRVCVCGARLPESGICPACGRDCPAPAATL